MQDAQGVCWRRTWSANSTMNFIATPNPSDRRSRSVHRERCLLDPSQRHVLDAVVGTFVTDQTGALAGREDVFVKVLFIDAVPNFESLSACLFGSELGVAVKVGGRIAKCGLTKAHEAPNIPFFYNLGIGIEI